MDRPKHELDLERSICRAVVKAILAAGYNAGVYDGEEFAIMNSDNLTAIMKETWTTDEDMIYAYDKATGKAVGWVSLIYGNGADLISDYTFNLEQAMTPALKYAESKQ
jgi:hypothetical protein